MLSIQRPSNRVLTFPPGALEVRTPGGGAAAWWMAAGVTPIAAYQAKGAVSYAASLVNLANPGTYDLTEGNGAVPWATGTGWGFVAAQQKALESGVTPVNNQTWSMIIQYAGVLTAAYTCLMGGSGGAGPWFLVYPNSAGTSVVYCNGGGVVKAPPLLAGNLAVAGTKGYRDGIDEEVTISSQAGVMASVSIAAQHYPGAYVGYITANIYACAIYSSTLTAPQVLAAATAMAAL